MGKKLHGGNLLFAAMEESLTEVFSGFVQIMDGRILKFALALPRVPRGGSGSRR